MIREWFAAGLMILGGLFMLLAAIGILRMPDLFTRMSASTKGSTIGVGLLILAVAVYFPDFGVGTRALLVIVFGVVTTPVAAHMIGRAAYFIGVPLWDQTLTDELGSRYAANEEESTPPL